MAKIKRKVAEDAVINKTEAENSQLELFKIKQTTKQLAEREKELKDRLAKYMEKALTPDGKGHRLLTTVDSEGNRVHLQRQARKSISLNQERAQAFLKANNLEELIVENKVVAKEVTQDQIIEILEKYAPEFLDTETKVDEKLLEQEVMNENISMTDFEDMCDIKITYAMTFIDDKKLQQEE